MKRALLSALILSAVFLSGALPATAVSLTCPVGGTVVTNHSGGSPNPGPQVLTGPSAGTVEYQVGTSGAFFLYPGYAAIFNGDNIRYTNTNTGAPTDTFNVGGVVYNVTMAGTPTPAPGNVQYTAASTPG